MTKTKVTKTGRRAKRLTAVNKTELARQLRVGRRSVAGWCTSHDWPWSDPPYDTRSVAAWRACQRRHRPRANDLEFATDDEGRFLRAMERAGLLGEIRGSEQGEDALEAAKLRLLEARVLLAELKVSEMRAQFVLRHVHEGTIVGMVQTVIERFGKWVGGFDQFEHKSAHEIRAAATREYDRICATFHTTPTIELATDEQVASVRALNATRPRDRDNGRADE